MKISRVLFVLPFALAVVPATAGDGPDEATVRSHHLEQARRHSAERAEQREGIRRLAAEVSRLRAALEQCSAASEPKR